MVHFKPEIDQPDNHQNGSTTTSGTGCHGILPVASYCGVHPDAMTTWWPGDHLVTCQAWNSWRSVSALAAWLTSWPPGTMCRSLPWPCPKRRWSLGSDYCRGLGGTQEMEIQWHPWLSAVITMVYIYIYIMIHKYKRAVFHIDVNLLHGGPLSLGFPQVSGVWKVHEGSDYGYGWLGRGREVRCHALSGHNKPTKLVYFRIESNQDGCW